MADNNLRVVALFGATGQIGAAILSALIHPPTEGYQPIVLVFISPGTDKSSIESSSRVECIELDCKQASKEDLAKALNGVDAVVSALNGPAITIQYQLLDACADAGVKRFIPSEFGAHHVFRTPSESGAWLHPMLDEKERFNEHLKMHPAVESGATTFTLIGAGDFYDQAREPFWCPWMHDTPSFSVPVVGDPDVPVDWSSIIDNGRYVAAVLAAPERTANASLNFPSWIAPQSALVTTLKCIYPDRKVSIRHISLEEAHGYMKNPNTAPKELRESTNFAVDFWLTVKSIQGQGLGRRPRSEVHNEMFPAVTPTPLEDFLRARIGKHE